MTTSITTQVDHATMTVILEASNAESTPLQGKAPAKTARPAYPVARDASGIVELAGRVGSVVTFGRLDIAVGG